MVNIAYIFKYIFHKIPEITAKKNVGYFLRNLNGFKKNSKILSELLKTAYTESTMENKYCILTWVEF